MPRHRFSKTFVAAAAALALVAAPMTAASAADVVLSDDDFTSPLSSTWRQSGGPTLSIAEVDGDPALQVANRANDFDGIETAPGVLDAGQTYSVSMRVRLDAAAAGPANLKIVYVPGYTTVGAELPVTSDAWTTLSGQFTVAAGVSDAKVYIGSAPLAGPYTYFVDDLVLTQIDAPEQTPITPSPGIAPGGYPNPSTTEVATAQGTGNVAALTFDDGPAADTPALLDFLAEEGISAVFCVIGSQIEAPGGAELLRRIVAEGHVLCNHSTGFDDMGEYSVEQAQADLEQTLTIIRTALGDDDAPVPFFRAPNGSWGQTKEVAVALGMQPLAVTNTIQDWDGNDLSVETLEANIRTAMQPGQILLAHDGPANRANTVAAMRTVVTERLAEGWSFTLPTGTPAAVDPGTPGATVISTSFEEGLDGWQLRRSSNVTVAPTLETTTDQARTGTSSAVVANRGNQGDGIGFPVIGTLLPGVTYDLSAWVRFAPGQTAGDVWVTLQADSSFQTVAQATGFTNNGWTELTASVTMPTSELTTGLLYFETAYVAPPATGNISTFYVDDISVTQAEELVIQELEPIKDTVPFPVGVAIDSRETAGAQSQLVQRHFDQLSSENFMKPEAFYTAQGEFSPSPEGDLLMQYALDNGNRVWGHTLVWHAQTPAFFFQDESGAPLTDSEADQAILAERMRTHIYSVAEYYATEFGEYGAENPIIAFDVVNEVVNDGGQFDDGLRRSEWYRILGEDFIDLAFQYADEAFNDVYAAEGSDRPVTLFINDYNTEQQGKQNRMYALLERLIERGVPVDGIGHQFHVSLSFPVAELGATIDRFSDLPLTQAVTELDVTTGTPETEALFIDQGYYYRDAFRDFRERAEELFSVTIWGLTDNRSWRAANGGPLLFDARLQAKPAYYGVIDGELEAPQRVANVFQGEVGLGEVDSPEWDRLPLEIVEGETAFQLRWSGSILTAYVTVDDATDQAGDAVTFEYEGETVTVERGDAGTVEREGGYDLVVPLTLPAAATEGDLLAFDLRVTDGSTTVGWNSPGVLGTLTLLEPLSFTETVAAEGDVVIDGGIDEAWAAANSFTTAKQVEGTSGAQAEVRTLWRDSTLYVLAEVADPIVDVTGSDPWIQDSVEMYIDAGNVKNGPYRYDDMQVRISAENVVSFGVGDEGFQRGRVESATTPVEGGYIVEAAISLLDSAGEGTFHGLDVQVNDAANGARSSITNWADPSGAGYQSTSRWGVAQLVGSGEVVPDGPVVSIGAGSVAAGGAVRVELAGFEPGDEVSLELGAAGIQPASLSAAALSPAAVLQTVTVGDDGTAAVTLTVPAGTAPGAYVLSAIVDGVVLADAPLTVTAAATGGGAAPDGAGSGGGALAVTGAEAAGIIALALLLLALGVAALVVARRREARLP